MDGYGPWIQGGAAGILAVVVVAIVFGRLWPLRTVEKLERDKDEQIKTLWAAHKAMTELNSRQSDQNDELLRQGREILAIVKTIAQTRGWPDG